MTEQEKKNLLSHAKANFKPGMLVECAFDGITRKFRGGMYVNKEGSVISLDGDTFLFHAPTNKWAEISTMAQNQDVQIVKDLLEHKAVFGENPATAPVYKRIGAVTNPEQPSLGLGEQGKNPFLTIKAKNISLQGRVRVNNTDNKISVDSEKLIRRFPSGAVRSNNAGRPRPDWVSPYAIEAISMRMVGNVSDFGAANYLLGIPEEDCLESLVRHVEELKEAILITKDPAAIKDLAGAVGFNATALLHTIILKEKGLYKEVYPETQVLPVSEAKKDLTYVKK